jgi:hypothetical protein
MLSRLATRFQRPPPAGPLGSAPTRRRHRDVARAERGYQPKTFRLFLVISACTCGWIVASSMPKARLVVLDGLDDENPRPFGAPMTLRGQRVPARP